jgi:hypothetical protein
MGGGEAEEQRDRSSTGERAGELGHRTGNSLSEISRRAMPRPDQNVQMAQEYFRYFTTVLFGSRTKNGPEALLRPGPP